jgi:NTP pyrophosphatase (non-canonical NTP hydrolase)
LRLDEALEEVRKEVMRSGHKGPLRSPHEALGVLYEEFDEFADEVRANNVDFARDEATQVAAVAVRFLMDIYA